MWKDASQQCGASFYWGRGRIMLEGAGFFINFAVCFARMKEEATAKWNECLDLIRKRLNNETEFATWFKPTLAMSLRNNRLTLRVPSQFYLELYDGKYYPVFSSSLREVFGNSLKLDYEYPVVSNSKAGMVKINTGATIGSADAADKPADKKPAKPRKDSAKAAIAEGYMPQLNEALSFENYCVGPINKLPWTIAESIARQPLNSNFNPFFLYGDVGVGKTHLMQAIGLQVKKMYPEKRVVFLPMKEFQRLYQNAYLKKEIPAFLQWFMRCDVLLFDDLQEIAGSEGTLNNALFPIFNHLHQHGKQLVFTCDRPPQELEELEARLIDRFKWGIIEKLERPDATLRKKILTFKARKNGLNLKQEVIDYIADAPLKSVREIEGIVLGIMTRAISLGLEIDINLTKEVIERSVKPVKKKSINFEMIVEAVAEEFQLNSDVLFSKSRVKDVADARMTIMYLAQKLMGLSTGMIGRKLGRKHSTVIHGIKVISERVADDPEFADKITLIESKI